MEKIRELEAKIFSTEQELEESLKKIEQQYSILEEKELEISRL